VTTDNLTAAEQDYDVFLSYNSADRAAVDEIARRLREARVNCFQDTRRLIPGEPWQEDLEDDLGRSRTCAVFFGPDGLGKWQTEEMRIAISRRVSDPEFRVIPVLLPGVVLPEGKLPALVSRTTKVDFRPGLDDENAFDRLLSGIRGVAPRTEGEDEDLEIECPFRGLEVFDEDHARFFFGREVLTAHLVDQLREDRFLAVLGPSGSGKSSVVRAGLIPRLRKGLLGGDEEWPVVVVRPGTDPMDALATGLVQLSGTSGDSIGRQASILSKLKADPRGLHTVVQLAVGGAAADHRVVIVVDQFEEVFTAVEDEKQQNDFVAALLDASSVPGGPTVVVLTMRADFFGKCAAVPGLARRMSERDVLVPPMTEGELRESMVKPADLVGLQFEKGLVDAILDDLGNEPGSLPLLQHTLLELFNGRNGRWLTNDRYYAIGRVKGAIASRADRIFDSLSPEEQTAARRILLRLTQPGEGTEATRRRAHRDELIGSGARGTAAEAVIERFAQARLLTTDETSSGQEVVDVAHEALIRGWPKLRGWVEENPTALRVHRELTEATERWDHEGRKRGYLYGGPRLDEAKALASRYGDDLNDLERTFLKASLRARQRRLILAGGAVALFSATLAVLGIFSLIQGQQARQAAGEATARRLQSESVTAAAESPAMGQRLAVEALVRGQELGMDLSQLTDNAETMIGSGRYTRIPVSFDQGYTDPGGRVLVGSGSRGAAMFDARDGREIVAFEQPQVDFQFSRDPAAGVFIAMYRDNIELRRISDGSVIAGAATMGDFAFTDEPGALAVVVTYGKRDSATENTEPAEVRSLVDGAVIRKLAGPAQIKSQDDAERVLVGYLEGGAEVVSLIDGGKVATYPAIPTDGSLAMSPSGTSLLSVVDDACTVLSIDPPRSVDLGQPCPSPDSPDTWASFDRSGRIVQLGTQSRMRFVDAASGKTLTRIEPPFQFEAMSPGSTVIVATGAEGTRLYETRTGRVIADFPGGGYAYGVDFSQDDSLLYLPIGDNSALVSASTGKVLASGPTPPEYYDDEFGGIPNGGVGFSHDGKWLVTVVGNHSEVRRVSAADRPGVTVPYGASFWPENDDTLLISDKGLQRVEPDGTVHEVLPPSSDAMRAVDYRTAGSSKAALVKFTSADGKQAGPLSILTPDGRLHPLGDTVTSGQFSSDGDRSYIVARDSDQRTAIWDTSDTPRRLSAPESLMDSIWDPGARWLATRTATGETYLVNVTWLVAMADSNPSPDVSWLERQVCEGPPRKLVDDAALTQRLGEEPHSCRGF
jgi:hypothetical protein